MAASRRSCSRIITFIALLMGLFLCLGAIASPSKNLFSSEKPLSLEGLWRFKTGNDENWSKPGLDDHAWQKLEVPGYWDAQGHRGYKGEAWYRTRFELSMPPYERPIGLYLGNINDTDMVFLNGRLIGQTGKFGDHPQTMYGKERLYVVPAKAIRFQGENVLAVRIWHAPLLNHDVGGFASSGIALGDYEKFKNKLSFQDLWQLNTSLLILFLGFFLLPFYLWRKKAKENLFFFLLCLCVGIYGIMRSQFRFLLSDDFLLMKQFEYVTLFLAPLFSVEYALHLFERKRSPLVAILEGASLALALISALARNLSLNTFLLSPFYVIAIAQMLYMLFLLIVESSRRKPEAKVVAVGVGIFFLVGLNDMFLTQGVYRIEVDWFNAVNLTASSFLAVIFCMALSLAMRFLRTHEDLERNREELVRKGRQLYYILKVNQETSAIPNLDRLAEKLNAIAINLTKAQKGLIMMRDEKKIVVLASHGLLQQEEKMICLEFGDEIAFRGEIIRKSVDTTFSLCVPIKFEDEVKGACYLEKKSPFDEEDIGVLQAIMNQAAISTENAKLYELAITDGLTQLVAHRHFQALLQKETERASRYHRILSLIMLDIDFFKKLNDNYGHQAGDQVLIEVARLIKQGCRDVDIVARYGGEEFVLILPETDLEGAALVAERLRRKIEASEIHFQGSTIKVTVSLGVATFPRLANSKDALIQAADKAMYLSKERGRNRVSLADSPTETAPRPAKPILP